MKGEKGHGKVMMSEKEMGSMMGGMKSRMGSDKQARKPKKRSLKSRRSR